MATLRHENLSQKQQIKQLREKVAELEHFEASLPTSLRTIRKEYVALEKENNLLAAIVLEQE